MSRRVFFSFHYENDIWRASQIRNSWITKPDREAAGFWDAASWEQVKKKGDTAVKQWIDEELEGTSVTVVLIGSDTSTRKYVRYEILKSWEKGNGLIGIYIHNIKDSNRATCLKGPDPFTQLNYENINTYDWVNDYGYANLSKWIEDSLERAKSRKKS